MHGRALSVEATISNVQQIRESIQEVAAIEEQALQEYIMSQKGSSSHFFSIGETKMQTVLTSLECNILDIDSNYLKLVLYQSKYHWFEILDQLEEHL